MSAVSEDQSLSEGRRGALEPLPPSAKLVHWVLRHEGSCTQRQLAEETLLSARTVRHALDELIQADLVTEEVYIPDARKKLFRVTEER